MMQPSRDGDPAVSSGEAIPRKDSVRPHCIRVAVENWEDPARFAELLRLLKRYPGGIGQIALFTSMVHSPLPLAEMRRRAGIMKDRLARIREAGYVPAINILATIGHHEEDLPETPAGNYTLMTGADGRVCRGSVCMNDERYLREYIVPVYRMLAQAKPDVIWADDDIRYSHIPIGNGCFCDHCLELFNRECGLDLSRESLIGKLDGGDPAVRSAWLKHNSDTVSRLLKTIGDAVRSVDPGIRLGFMTGERYYEGYAFREWADALSDGGKYEILWRPGGGGYEDFRFDDIVEKSEQIGRQNAYLPAYVTERLSEVENFPYQLIRKTPTSTALEGAWSMTAGCTGAAFNILPSETGEPLGNINAHLRAVEKLRPFCELLREKVAGSPPVGIGTAWHPNDQVAVSGSFVRGWGGAYAAFARDLFDFGLPECYSPNHSLVTVLTGGCLRTYPDDKIRRLLKSGIYMDAPALQELNSRGFAPLTGFEIGSEFPADARERYTDHPMNRGIAGGIRNGRQAFYHGDSFALIPSSERAECLAELIDYHCRSLTDCCFGFYTNETGGHIAVEGYYPFNWISDAMKTEQLKRLMVRLSAGKLPSWVDTYCRIRNHSFLINGRTVVALLNPTNETLESLSVAVRTESVSAVWIDERCKSAVLKADQRSETWDSSYRFFTIPVLPPYEMALLEAEIK